MKVFSIYGMTGSGKTSVIENVIRELTVRGLSVGSVKEIHYEAFQIDTEGKNTWRHRIAGAETVAARSHNETDIMYTGHSDIYELLSHYTQDVVALEGVKDAIVPLIYCCKEDETPEITPLTIAISGRYANNHSGDYKGIPIINGITNYRELVDLLIKKMPPLMPNVEKECCGKCGFDCREFLVKMLKNEVNINDCVVQNSCVELTVDGKQIVMVPFVQKLLKNEILGVVKELKGYKKGRNITISFRDNE